MSSLSHAANSSMPPSPRSSASSSPFSTAPAPAAADQPRTGLGVRAALAVLRAYKYLISPYFAGACRFVPTCADYTAEAIARHGLLRGVWLGARRLGRCHPFCAAGHDPVPR